MTLPEYLSDAKLSQSQFAKRIGVRRQMIQRYCKGRIPEKAIMEKIALATGCKVTANDFFGIAA
jgi:transcriptional regulator with XRE-family HTH domain